MTIPTSQKLTKVQTEVLSELIALTDEDFKYALTPNHKRMKTLRALERRDLVRLEFPKDETVVRAYPTPYGRHILKQVQGHPLKFRKVNQLLNQIFS